MIVYDTNNSGGSWWLSDDDWKALEAAGWRVHWIEHDPLHRGAKRFLGALATSAERFDLTLDEAIDEWEKVTGMSADAEGCDCCGAPHYFYEDADTIEGHFVDGKEVAA